MTRSTAERLAESVRGARRTIPSPMSETAPVAAPVSEGSSLPRRARARSSRGDASTGVPDGGPSPALGGAAVRTDGGIPPSSAGERFPRRVWPD